METQLSASMPARRMPIAGGGGNQWRKKYLTAVNVSAAPPTVAAIATAGIASTNKRASLPSGVLSGIAISEQSVHPRGDSPDSPESPVDAGDAAPSHGLVAIPLQPENLFDGIGSSSARMRSFSVGDRGNNEASRTSAVPIPLGSTAAHVQQSSGVGQMYPRRPPYVISNVDMSADSGSMGDDSAVESPLRIRKAANRARNPLASDDDEDVFGFATETRSAPRDVPTKVGGRVEDRDRLGSSFDEATASSAGSGVQLGDSARLKGHISYAAAVMKSPMQGSASVSTDASVSPIVAPLAELLLEGPAAAVSRQLLPAGVAEDAGRGVSGTRRLRKDFNDVGVGGTPPKSLADSDETGSKSKRMASEGLSTTTDGDDDSSRYEEDEPDFENDDDVVTGSLLDEMTFINREKKKVAAGLRRAAHRGRSKKALPSRGPLGQARSSSIGSAGSSQSGSLVGGRYAHKIQNSPVSVSGRGHHPGSPMALPDTAHIVEARLLQAARFLGTDTYMQPDGGSRDAEEEDEGEGEDGDDDDDDGDDDEAADAIGSLPHVLPVGKGVGALPGRDMHASYALRSQSGAMLMPKGPHPALAGHPAANMAAVDKRDRGRGVRGATQLAAVPASDMQLGSSFVPPHLLAAADAARDDLFSLGMRAQMKAKPRNV